MCSCGLPHPQVSSAMPNDRAGATKHQAPKPKAGCGLQQRWSGFLLDKPIPSAREFCLVNLTPAPGMTLAFGSQSNGSSRTRRSVKERRLSRISLSAALAAVACVSLGSTTLAQDEETNILLQANQQWPKPMFAALPPRYPENLLTPSSHVTYWSGTFSTGRTDYRFSTVGTNPARTDTTITVTRTSFLSK
jgi:hypothetical protein